MSLTKTYDRLAWEDRFNRPTVDQLRASLEQPLREVFDQLRRRLLEIDGVVEDFGWHGDCWRWAIEYRTRLSDDPLALVVPAPADLQLAVPLTAAVVESLPRRQLKRSIRDGIDLVREPFDTRWGVWSVASATAVDDLLELIERKREHLGSRSR